MEAADSVGDVQCCGGGDATERFEIRWFDPHDGATAASNKKTGYVNGATGIDNVFSESPPGFSVPKKLAVGSRFTRKELEPR